MSANEHLNDQLSQMFKKAHRSIGAARDNIREGDYDFGSLRAYYAAFYAIEEANEDVAIAEQLIGRIETYLIQNDFLKNN